jgi:D-alanyl-D-alanine-carboxypeptidase/D-alanyl-D-alanine-endopeptidase
MSAVHTDPEREVDRELAAAVSRGHRALVAGVVRDGETVCRGWAADGPAPDATALFEIGSVTKVFTGVLLADMHLRGEVSLDDRLSRHLPEPRPAWRYREPTLLELATHRSGLPNTPGPMRRRELAHGLGLREGEPWAGVTAEDYRRLVSQESPRKAPGTGFRYSSMAVGLLGDALAARAGRTYEELLTERVLQPLGMTSTWVTVPPEHAHRLLRGHSSRGRPRPPLLDLLPAGGSLRSDVADVTRFLTACLAPPDGPVGAALRLAQQPHVHVRKRFQIGLCWLISTYRRDLRVVWHNGGTWGFTSFAGLSPERRAAAVVLLNTARGVDRAGLRLLQGAR